MQYSGLNLRECGTVFAPGLRDKLFQESNWERCQPMRLKRNVRSDAQGSIADKLAAEIFGKTSGPLLPPRCTLSRPQPTVGRFAGLNSSFSSPNRSRDNKPTLVSIRSTPGLSDVCLAAMTAAELEHIPTGM